MEVLIKHQRQRQQSRLLSACFKAWISSNHVQNTERAILDKLSQLLDKVRGFGAIRTHSFHLQIKKRELNTALKHWASHLKSKVLHSFTLAIERREQKRDNAFKVMIFEESLLRRHGFQAFQQNRLRSKAHRRLNFKALKHFSKLYKLFGFRSFLANVDYRHAVRLTLQKQLMIQIKRQELILKTCFTALRQQSCLNSERIKLFIHLLTRNLEVLPVFKQLKQQCTDQQAMEQTQILKKGFKAFQVNLQQCITEKSQNEVALKLRIKNLKSQSLALFRDGILLQLRQRQALSSLCHQLQLRTGFNLIKLTALKKAKLEKLCNIVIQSNLKQAFLMIKISVKLEILSDKLLWEKIRFRQLFSHWKDLALEDKRIQKMMIRAARHRNRVIRRKAFLLLKRTVVPTVLIMPSRILQLKGIAFKTLKHHRMRKAVTSNMIRKALHHWSLRLGSTVFGKWYTYARQRNLRGISWSQASSKIQKESTLNLLTKGLQGFKRSAYISRVKRYLNQTVEQRIKLSYLTRVKDAYIRMRTKNFRTIKADAHYSDRLTTHCFHALADHRRKNYIQNCRIQQVSSHYCYRLQRKGFLALYTRAQRGRYHKQLIENARIEGIQEKLQGAFLQMVKVGLYWAQIKGRYSFSSSLKGGHSSGQSMYLGLKYGLRWRAYALLRRFTHIQENEKAKVTKLKVNSRMITEAVKRVLLVQRPKETTLTTESQPAKLVISKQSIQYMPTLNKLPQQLQMKDQTNFSFSSEANLLLASDRMNDIESQIKAFKSKKLLLKELEDQLKTITSQQHTLNPITALLASKIENLKQELRQQQPLIRDLLNEISNLKSADVSHQSTPTTMSLRSSKQAFSYK